MTWELGAQCTFVALVHTANGDRRDRLDHYPVSTSGRLHPDIERGPGRRWRGRIQSGVGEDEPQEHKSVPRELGPSRQVGRRQGDRQWQSVVVLRPLCVDYLPPSCGLSILSEFL